MDETMLDGNAVAGLLHDIGKRSAEYQLYIRGQGPSPDHSTAGAVEAVRLYGNQAGGAFARLIAFAVAGHHAGLADGTGGGSALDNRLRKSLPNYGGWEAHAEDLPTHLDVSLAKAPHARSTDPAYSLAFLGRMLFSCLVDADFLATEAFYARANRETVERGGHTPLGTLRERLDTHLNRFAGASGQLNALRAEILTHAAPRPRCRPACSR